MSVVRCKSNGYSYYQLAKHDGICSSYSRKVTDFLKTIFRCSVSWLAGWMDPGQKSTHACVWYVDRLDVRAYVRTYGYIDMDECIVCRVLSSGFIASRGTTFMKRKGCWILRSEIEYLCTINIHMLNSNSSS